jgi:pyruvate dehydrogenase kinase 2/3/4
MPSIIKVKNWYAESFQDLIELQTPQISQTMREQLVSKASAPVEHLPQSVPNPSLVKIIKPHNPLQASVPISQR